MIDNEMIQDATKMIKSISERLNKGFVNSCEVKLFQ